MNIKQPIKKQGMKSKQIILVANRIPKKKHLETQMSNSGLHYEIFCLMFSAPTPNGMILNIWTMLKHLSKSKRHWSSMQLFIPFASLKFCVSFILILSSLFFDNSRLQQIICCISMYCFCFVTWIIMCLKYFVNIVSIMYAHSYHHP